MIFILSLKKGMGFITMMVARFADHFGNPTTLRLDISEGIDVNILLVMTIYAYFFIVMVQLIGIFGGDKSPLQVRIKQITLLKKKL